MKFMTQLTHTGFIGLGLMLSICLLVSPALAQVEMDTLDSIN